jgi:hypothetical protein
MSRERSMDLCGRPAAIFSMAVGRCMAIGALGLLSGAALMVVGRRLAGALERPLDTIALLTAGLLVAIAAAAIRVGWIMLPAARSSSRWLGGMMVLTSLAVAALGAGLCVSGTPLATAAILWVLLATEEGGAWVWHLRHRFGRTPPKGQRIVRLDAAHATASRAGRVGAAALMPPEEVTQQLTRRRAADGVEELSGWLRMPFAAGQRSGSVHVAFCPPFAATPALEVEQIDGPEARIKTAQLLPYGARLDLKLAAAAEQPTAVLLQFSARTAYP